VLFCWKEVLLDGLMKVSGVSAGEQVSARTRITALLVVPLLLPWPLMFSGRHWWAYVPSTVLIMLALRVLAGQAWPEIAGLRMPPSHSLVALLIFVGVAVTTKSLMPPVYEREGLILLPPRSEQQLGLLFQTLNEEIFFRAVLLGTLLRYLRPRVLVTVGLAVLFAAAHYLLYRFPNPLHVSLSWTALATLFCAGLTMNNLYAVSGHIGFAWAFHAGWNIVWLPAVVSDAVTKERLHEPQVFDRVLGSSWILGVALALAVITWVTATIRQASVK
jgi:membrane protease YdiL (CAAX protease family)